MIGGTGFVGQSLAAGWRNSGRPLRYLVHRRSPSWLTGSAIDVRQVDLEDEDSIAENVAGSSAVINLLRPLGDGWYPSLLGRMAPVLRQAGVVRYVHTSSIDIFSGSTEQWVNEGTPPKPRTDYEREHVACEQIVTGTFDEPIILRLGAVFGPSGRNIVSFADEIASRRNVKIVLRRLLNGARRMHLVSAETVTRALAFMTLQERPAPYQVFLVTDDAFEENNFRFVQDVLADAYGRPDLKSIPSLPQPLLKATLVLRGKTPAVAGRRFSPNRLHALGFENSDFPNALRAYAAYLAERS